MNSNIKDFAEAILSLKPQKPRILSDNSYRVCPFCGQAYGQTEDRRLSELAHAPGCVVEGALSYKALKNAIDRPGSIVPYVFEEKPLQLLDVHARAEDVTERTNKRLKELQDGGHQIEGVQSLATGPNRIMNVIKYR